MDADRWRRIEALYHAAQERALSERSAFLAQACADDPSLRDEVQSLLEQRGEPPNFATRTLSPQSRFGPYEILGPLGAGGMGEVYRALDSRLGRQVALKISARQFSGRFDREARAVAALNHPNICTLYDVGENFLVMELVEGESLAARLSKGPMELDAVLRDGMYIADALDAAHSHGIIHRDLKPANIMLTGTGLKILDFGLAKFAGSTGDDITAPHAVIGSAPYMAPEQASGLELDQRADLFSFGVVLYEMATGQRPFRGETWAATIAAILNHQPPLASKLNPALPAGLDRVIAKALEKDRERRYQSAAEMRADLERLLVRPGRVSDRGRSSLLKTASLVALLAAILVALTLWLGGSRWRLSSAGPTKRMLAVLPFQNLSGDLSKEYLSDGLTEELITALSRIEPSRLGVIARTSAMFYKNRQVRTDQIGRELGVDYLLEGTVRPEAGRVRVSVQLIQVRDQSNLWADSYDIGSSEALALQREITRRVARSMAINLLPERQAALDRASTSNPEAYEAYLNGRYQWNQRTGPALRRAADYFKSASEHDAGFAAAYADQASSLEMLDVYGAGLEPGRIEQEKELLEIALRLDPELSEAYATRGSVHERGDWDRHAAETDYRRAVELNPGNATAHAWYGEFLYLSGRLKESWPELKAAEKLDPQSPAIQTNIGWWYLLSHRYDESVTHHRRQLAKWPKFGILGFVLGQTFDQMKRYPEALAAYQQSIEGSGRVPFLIAGMASSYALAGNRPAALRLLAELETPSGECHPTGAPATVYASLGESDKALACIERGIEQHSPLVAWMKVSPALQPLHGDPRFAALLRRAGFDVE